MPASARPSWRALALIFVVGAVAGLGQAPWDAWYLSLPAFSFAFWRASAAPTARYAAWTGWVFGAGHFTLALSWIIEPFLVDIIRHGWMAPFAIALLAGGLALFWGLAFWLAARFSPRNIAVSLIAVWTLTEMLRGVVFTGFPWAMPGHIWIDTPVRLLATWAGAPGLTLLTFLIAGLPFVWHRGWIGGSVSLGLGVMAFGYGALSLGSAQVVPTDKIVRLVQPNAVQHQKWDPEMIPTFFSRLVEATGADGDPDLILWPESALAWRLDRAERPLEIMAAQARGKTLVFGVNDLVDGAYRNALVVMGPDGTLGEPYHKHHLTPFGEYIPLGELAGDLGIRGLAARDGGGFATGPGPELIDLPGIGKAMPLICYEMIFPRHLRSEERPQVILHITNDAWFGEVSGPYQHLAQARLRATEQGLPLLRAANTGVSAVIDPMGRILAELPLGAEGYVDYTLPAPLAQPRYPRIGDWPLGLLLAVAFLGTLARGRAAKD